MIRAAASLTLALGLATAATAETDFSGTYRADAGGLCTNVGEEDGALKIEGDIFYGAGSQCQMTNPVDVRAMDATLFDFVCNDDEVEWRVRAFLSLGADDGLIMVSDGFAFKYDRCSPDDALGTVTTAPVIGVEAQGVDANSD